MTRDVVVIVMDTVRAGNLSLSSDIRELFATVSESSTAFRQTFTSAPWTLPSHASLFTGMTPSKHGAHAGHKKLDTTYTTLPEILSDQGYETVAVSNNTWISEEFGFDQGFETFYKTWQYVQSDTDLGKIAQMEEGADMFIEATKAIFDGNPITNLANALYGQFFRKSEDDGAKRTNEWISDWLSSREDTDPFFLFVNYLEPHLEYRPPEEHAREHLPDDVSYDEAMEVPQDAWEYIAGETEISNREFEILRSLYRAEISYLNERIDEVIRLLKEAGEWEDTLFIVTSDHGENIGEHGLMDHQYSLYDTLIHVPLYIKGDRFDEVDTDQLIQLVDLPPTILDALGIEAPKAREQFQGISFYPESGTGQTREFAVAEYMAPQPSMEALEKRVGKLPENVLKYDRSLRAIRTNQYKYIRGSDGSKELYDIQNDPEEMNNIAEEKSGITESLDSKLDQWLDSFEHTDHTGKVSMDEDTKARLEDLGYLQ